MSLPPAQYAPQSYDDPPRRRKRRSGLFLGLVGAGSIALLVLVVVAGVLISNHNRTVHDVSAPDTAGGLTRDRDTEKQMSSQLERIESQFRASVTTGFRQFVTAVYTKPRTDDAGPAGSIVLVAATFPKSGNPADFVNDFRQSSAKRAGFTVVTVPAGKDAQGVCAASTTSLKLTQCAWSTNDSFGELLPATAGWDTDQLSTLMRKVRADVEKPRD
jgi:hypothetical protein